MSLFKPNEMLVIVPTFDASGKKVTNPEFSGKSGMLLVAASWCIHCQNFKPTFIKFRKIVGDGFVVAAVDAVASPEETESLGVSGFPTLMSIDATGRFKILKIERDLTSLVTEMCKVHRAGVCLR
jgi:thiol-disulfide isomerase/thioredoxin